MNHLKMSRRTFGSLFFKSISVLQIVGFSQLPLFNSHWVSNTKELISNVSKSPKILPLFIQSNINV